MIDNSRFEGCTDDGLVDDFERLVALVEEQRAWIEGHYQTNVAGHRWCRECGEPLRWVGDLNHGTFHGADPVEHHGDHKPDCSVPRLIAPPTP